MTPTSFWLNYYSGSIKAFLVLACLLGVILIGVANLSLLQGFLYAIGTAIAVIGGAALLQRWLINRHIRSTRVIDHPEFGRISVYKDRWDAQLHAIGLPWPCALTGTSASGIPTQDQISLWHAIRDELQSLLSAARQALSAEPRSDDQLGLTAIMLLNPGAFVFFLAPHPQAGAKRRAFFVRFENMAVAEAGRTPWKRPRKPHEG
jgi:hypothetical protein